METVQFDMRNYTYWAPWTGCTPISEGCEHCIVLYKSFYDSYRPFTPRIEKGGMIKPCPSSDFFLQDADKYRDLVWATIKENSDNVFMIITKRVDRIAEHLPADWGDGYDNVIICVTAENQQRADERLPIFAEIPCKHRWITCSPILEEIDLTAHLATGKFESVDAHGERSYHEEEVRATHYNWIKNLHDQCLQYDLRFHFLQVGQNFVMPDGQVLQDPPNTACYHSELADSLELNIDKPIYFNLATMIAVY